MESPVVVAADSSGAGSGAWGLLEDIAFKTLAIYCDENKHLFEMVRSRDAASHAGSWVPAKHAKSGTCPADDSAVVARLQCLAG
jgi:hypothetical protein